MKVLIIDSGILINLSLNGLLYIIPELKKKTGARFMITKDVKYEVVDRPLNVPRFELGALRVKDMINKKEIEMPEDFGIEENELNKLRDELMNLANHALKSKDKWIQVVSNAEISCLAASHILSQRKVENMIGVDERTTRLLFEKPQNLENIMSAKLHTKIKLESGKPFENYDFKFIRSTELVYVAFKKGVLKIDDPKILEASLFATKYHGASVSFEEINELKKL